MKLGVTAWLSVLSAVLPTASGQPAQTQHANAATYIQCWLCKKATIKYHSRAELGKHLYYSQI